MTVFSKLLEEDLVKERCFMATNLSMDSRYKGQPFSFWYDFVWRDLGPDLSDAYISGLTIENTHPLYKDRTIYVPVEVHGQDIEVWQRKVLDPLLKDFDRGRITFDDMRKKLQGEQFNG